MPTDPKFVFQRFYDGLKDRGYVIYPGKLTVADSFRMGCIGRLYPEHMKGALAAVREVLDEHAGQQRRPGAGGGVGQTMAPDSINTQWRRDRRQRPPLSPAQQPVVVVCVDGSEPGYIERAVEAGRAPWFAQGADAGHQPARRLRRAGFTNPNNLSIVTGAPPAVHGICGNYFFDPDTGQGSDDERPEVPAGRDAVPGLPARRRRIAVVTAKDKLRGLLGKGLELGAGQGLRFSSEKADKASLAENGIDKVIALVGMPCRTSTAPTCRSSCSPPASS